MGKFKDFIVLDNDDELDVIVEYTATVDRCDQWTPPCSEVEIEGVELVGDWPEGLSQDEFKRACKRAEDRHCDRAWDDLAMHYEDQDRRAYEEEF